MQTYCHVLLYLDLYHYKFFPNKVAPCNILASSQSPIILMQKSKPMIDSTTKEMLRQVAVSQD